MKLCFVFAAVFMGESNNLWDKQHVCMQMINQGTVYIHSWLQIWMEISLVHMHAALQWLRFIKEDHRYTRLYKAAKKNANAHFCLSCD